jgi:hypothetical protein
MAWLGWHTDVMHSCTGLRAIAEVDVPPVVNFAKDYKAGQLRRLLALECVQDPGNLVRLILILFRLSRQFGSSRHLPPILAALDLDLNGQQFCRGR